MIYTDLLSLLLAEYAANQKCSAILLCSADSIYPMHPPANSSRSRGVGYREGINELRQCSQRGGIWVGSESGECRELFIFQSSGTGSSGVLT